MRLKEALEREKQRENADSWNKIYMNKDGMFWHIYDWSAWLLKTVVCTEDMQQERGDKKMLSATRYQTKNCGEYVIVGFPLESMGKYLPDYADITPVENGNGDVIIEVILPEEILQMDFETLENAYKQWWNQCPQKEQKPKNKTVSVTVQGTQERNGMFNIISQIISYPLEKKTPTDNIEFISQLKQQIVSLL